MKQLVILSASKSASKWVLTLVSKIYPFGVTLFVILELKYSPLTISNPLFWTPRTRKHIVWRSSKWNMIYSSLKWVKMVIFSLFGNFRRTRFSSTFSFNTQLLMKISSKFKKWHIPDMFRKHRITIKCNLCPKLRHAKNFS